MEATAERVNPPWLEQGPLRGLMETLNDDGFEAFAVGGCVRDAILPCECNDIDIATNATPVQVLQSLKPAGYKMIPTGVEHGTWTVMKHGHVFEVTTYRRDVTTNGRRATIEYAQSMEEDAERRDFTMNALYMDAEGWVYDPTGTGVDDAKKGLVRFVGDSETRCREDYLRIMRFFRFFVTRGCGVFDHAALRACTIHAPGLKDISGERVLSELVKLFKADNRELIERALAVMEMMGILDSVGLVLNESNLNMCLWAEKTTKVKADWRTRFCVAFEGNTRLPMSKKDRIFIEKLWKLHQSGSQYAWKGLAVVEGHELAEQFMLLKHEVVRAKSFAQLKPPYRSSDFVLAGYDEGPQMGRAMKAAKEHWLLHDLGPGKDSCLNHALNAEPPQ